jgi:hypothetical protein
MNSTNAIERLREVSAGQTLKDATLQVFIVSDETTALLPRLTIGNQDQGAFAFSALPKGWPYEIHAAAPGYERSTVQVPADKTQTGLLELPPIKLKSAIPPKQPGDRFLYSCGLRARRECKRWRRMTWPFASCCP